MAYKKRQADCQNCGREFMQAYPDKKYCSKVCYDIKRDAQKHKNCETCGQRFNYFKSRGVVKFCSRKCYYRAPKTDEFKQKISKAFRGDNHPNWKGGVMKGRKDRNLMEYKNWRLAVFVRDKFTCVWCGIKNHKGLGKTVVLEADHIKSWTSYPELRYEVDNGRTLCRGCHSKRTAEQHRERMNHATI